MNTHAARIRTARRALSAVAILTLVGTATAGPTPQYAILIKLNDPVDGVGPFFRVDNVAVNNAGQWLIEGDTTNPDTNADQVLINNDGLLLQEGDALAAPAGSTLGSFDAITLNNNGDSGWNIFIDGPPTNQDSGVFFNTTLLIQESFISTAPQFSPDTPYIGFFETKINDANQILIVASVDDPNIASTVDRAMVRVDYDANTNSFTETVLSKEGDLLLGFPIADYATGPHNFAFNNNATAAFIFDTTAATSEDSGIIIHRNGENEVIAQEGQPSAIDAERLWGSFASATLDLNNSDNYAFKVNLAGPTEDNTVIVLYNGGFTQIARKNSDVPASIGGGFQFENFGSTSTPVALSDDNDVLYYADWNNPDTTRDAALMINDEPILLEGITLIDDYRVIAIINTADAFAMSDNGRFVIAEVTLEDPTTLASLNAAILIDRFPATSKPCDGDANNDGLVNADDLGILLNAFGCTGPECAGDFDGNGVVDANDLGILLNAFGSNCDNG